MSTFTPDPKGIADFLSEKWALDHVDRVDKALVSLAARAAPFGVDQRRGHIRNRFEIEPARPTSHGAEGAAGNTDRLYHLIEFGSANNQPYRPLTRAALELGLDLEETSK